MSLVTFIDGEGIRKIAAKIILINIILPALLWIKYGENKSIYLTVLGLNIFIKKMSISYITSKFFTSKRTTKAQVNNSIFGKFIHASQSIGTSYIFITRFKLIISKQKKKKNNE